MVKDLTKGEETGRAVRVALDDTSGHVMLLRGDESGRPLLDVDNLLLGRSKEFQLEVKSIIQGLNDVLPPPEEIEPDGTTTEEELERLELLPSENVKRMLQNGRLLKKRRSRKSE
jgi:hypothetical protein